MGIPSDFNPYDNLLSRFDTELKILLDSVSSATEYNKLSLKHIYTKRLLEVCQAYFKETQSCIKVDDLIKDSFKFIRTGVLDYLTLHDNEFSKEPNPDGEYVNLRHDCLYKKGVDPNIYFKRAYGIEIHSIYNQKYKNIFKYEIPVKHYNSYRIYLQESGYITNQYFEDVIVPAKHIGLFTLQSKIILPVEKYIGEDNSEFLFINSRNPKLKALMEFYKVPFHKDERMLNEKGESKYNIRKFKEIK